MFNKKLYQTKQGHELKFTSVTKQIFQSQDLNYHLNAAMDHPMSKHNSVNKI